MKLRTERRVRRVINEIGLKRKELNLPDMFNILSGLLLLFSLRPGKQYYYKFSKRVGRLVFNFHIVLEFNKLERHTLVINAPDNSSTLIIEVYWESREVRIEKWIGYVVMERTNPLTLIIDEDKNREKNKEDL